MNEIHFVFKSFPKRSLALEQTHGFNINLRAELTYKYLYSSLLQNNVLPPSLSNYCSCLSNSKKMIFKKFIGDFKTRTIIPVAKAESLPRPQQQGLRSSSIFRLQSNLVYSLWIETQALGPDPGPPHRPRPGPLPAPPAPHPGTIFARSGTARPAGPGPLTGVAARLALLGLRGAAPRHRRRRRRRPTPRPHTHSHTYTRRSAHARGPAAEARRAPGRARAAGGAAQAAAEPRASARGPHGGKTPERADGRVRPAPTSAGSMARWAALGALGAGARWGRGAAPCACALRRSGLGGRRAAGPRRRRGRTDGLTGGSPEVLGSRVHLAGMAVGKVSGENVCWSLCRVRLSAAPWTVARQASLSMGFSRQGY